MPHRNYLTATALGLCLLLACRSREPDGVALVGATLIDGTGGPPLEASAVVIRAGHIESVGLRSDFRLPERTTEVDLTGRWIMPGLVDGHVHLVDPVAGVAQMVDAPVPRVGGDDRAGPARPPREGVGAAPEAEPRRECRARGCIQPAR